MNCIRIMNEIQKSIENKKRITKSKGKINNSTLFQAGMGQFDHYEVSLFFLSESLCTRP